MTGQNIVKQFLKITILVFFALFTTTIYADDDTGFDDGEGNGDNVDDESPVNSYILPMLAAGVAAGYVVLRKKQQAK